MKTITKATFALMLLTFFAISTSAYSADKALIKKLVLTGKWDEVVKIGKPAAPEVESALNSDGTHIRANAARTLGKIKSFRSVDPLIGRLSDTKEIVRTAAKEALIIITGEDFGADDEEWRNWHENYLMTQTPAAPPKDTSLVKPAQANDNQTKKGQRDEPADILKPGKDWDPNEK
ncbi:HEAT repeat domain-containing protein [Thermodesulfobacteriota bacterium]